jgi:ABC-type transport system involved in cytochrome bd biosynthesis fused ATPase/permease subunit
MSSTDPIEAELTQTQQTMQELSTRKQQIIHEIEDEVKLQMKTAQRKLRYTLPVGIVIGLALWGTALWMNLRKNTGAALETYPCAVPILLIVLGIIAVVGSIWLGIPKETQLRKKANDDRTADLDAIKKELAPLQIRERQLKTEMDRQRYLKR